MDEDYFDFSQVQEEKEELDFENLRPCLHCGKPIPSNATLCLYCGKSIPYSKKPLWSIAIAVILLIIFIILILLG